VGFTTKVYNHNATTTTTWCHNPFSVALSVHLPQRCLRQQQQLTELCVHDVLIIVIRDDLVQHVYGRLMSLLATARGCLAVCTPPGWENHEGSYRRSRVCKGSGVHDGRPGMTRTGAPPLPPPAPRIPRRTRTLGRSGPPPSHSFPPRAHAWMDNRPGKQLQHHATCAGYVGGISTRERALASLPTSTAPTARSLVLPDGNDQKWPLRGSGDGFS